jgi:hypothetical protein
VGVVKKARVRETQREGGAGGMRQMEARVHVEERGRLLEGGELRCHTLLATAFDLVEIVSVDLLSIDN